jgi:hypothetical protein
VGLTNSATLASRKSSQRGTGWRYVEKMSDESPAERPPTSGEPTTSHRAYEPWMCTVCFENPDDRERMGYASYGDLCGYHYGVEKGYYPE